MPELHTWQWLLGALCAFFVGMAKTGVPGLGALVVPLMVLAIGDARLSAGYLLPVLITADLFAVYYWRKHASAWKLFSLAPWVLIGMAGGALALRLDERYIRPMVAVIVLAMLGVYLYRQYLKKGFAVQPHPVVYGGLAGFATTVANAAGPVMNLYLLSKRLSKEEFIATGAWFFFFVNLAKVPVYLFHGIVNGGSLAFDAAMIPAVAAGAITGRWAVNHIPMKAFEALVIALTFISSLLLLR
ncbi:MAG: hypothetical protein C0504_03180 [Candidatus Solibacter sp.]|nr:hypothetical protein [Candidatus Solibacter sp.]